MKGGSKSDFNDLAPLELIFILYDILVVKD